MEELLKAKTREYFNAFKNGEDTTQIKRELRELALVRQNQIFAEKAINRKNL